MSSSQYPISVSVNVTIDVWQKLNAIAEGAGITRSAVLRAALDAWLSDRYLSGLERA